MAFDDIRILFVQWLVVPQRSILLLSHSLRSSSSSSLSLSLFSVLRSRGSRDRRHDNTVVFRAKEKESERTKSRREKKRATPIARTTAFSSSLTMMIQSLVSYKFSFFFASSQKGNKMVQKLDGFVKPSSCQWFAKTVYPLGLNAQVARTFFFFEKIKKGTTPPGWSHPGDIRFLRTIDN